MRKVLISLAAAAATFAVAAPASAQVYGNVTPYGHSPYNRGYGYAGPAFVQQMQARVQQVRAQIRGMAAQRVLSYREARRLDRQASAIERRIYRAPRNGIRPQEVRGLESRIRRLEARVNRQAWNGHRYYGRGYNRYYGSRY